MKTIKSITSDGLYYTDETGLDKFIDFYECNENWIKYRKRSEGLDDEKIENIKKVDKCIGQRDIGARPRFIEFFTRPFTRFEFESIAEEAFLQVKKDIIYAGWTTFDLS
ncbi:MAG: hypothetical protein J7639_05865 [Paenibacillaceae bacterium]|nr:hypothetical protein [Paenibacillaceae bacterium]